MAHKVRNTSEFLTEDTNFRVSCEGNLETDDLLLVQREDMAEFIAWITQEFRNATESTDG